MTERVCTVVDSDTTPTRRDTARAAAATQPACCGVCAAVYIRCRPQLLLRLLLARKNARSKLHRPAPASLAAPAGCCCRSSALHRPRLAQPPQPLTPAAVSRATSPRRTPSAAQSPPRARPSQQRLHNLRRPARPLTLPQQHAAPWRLPRPDQRKCAEWPVDGTPAAWERLPGCRGGGLPAPPRRPRGRWSGRSVY